MSVWPTADGTIRRALLTQRTEQSADLKYNVQLFGVSVDYDFVVNGLEYSGSRMSAAPTFSSSRSTALAKSSRYSAGQQVKVYYNPSDPRESVLQPRDGRRFGFLFMAAGAALIVGSVIHGVLAAG